MDVDECVSVTRLLPLENGESMSVWNAVIGRVIGTKNQRELKRLQPLVVQVNALEPDLEKLPDAALAARTAEFKERLARAAALDDILHEAFATVREVARRVLNMRHFDVQLIGGGGLFAGEIGASGTRGG